MKNTLRLGIVGFFAVTCVTLLSGCLEYVGGVKSWKTGTTICFLMKISGLPAGATDTVTITLVGGGLDMKQASFTGGNGYHQICIEIPGGMPAGSTHVSAQFKESASDGKTGHAEELDKPVSDIPATPPTIPAGTVVH